jgi:hypothetical protein
VLCGLAIACAATPRPLDPQAAVRRTRTLALDHWSRAELSGLTVYTNGEFATARRVLEPIRTYLKLATVLLPRAAPGAFSPRKPSEILLFGEPAQFRRFASSGEVGHMLSGDDAFAIGMHLDQTGGVDADDVAVLQHELVHLLLQNDPTAVYPPWFHEGFAEFLGATLIRQDVASIGGLVPFRIRMIRQTEPLPLERLLDSKLAWQPTFRDTLRIYSDGWAFVHYGMLSHGQGGPMRTRQFLAFVDATAHGAPWREALEQSFAAPLEQIEAEFHHHRRLLAESPVHPQVHVAVDVPEDEISFTPVPRPEMATRLGQYALLLGDEGGEEYDRMAADLFAVAWQADAPPQAALIGGVRAAARLHDLTTAEALWGWLEADGGTGGGEPHVEEAGADLALARFEVQNEAGDVTSTELLSQARAGYERVLAVEPQRRSALVGLGQTYLLDEDGYDPTPGIVALREAVAAEPRSPEVRLALARLLLRAHAGREAAAQLRWIIAAVPGTAPAREAEKLLPDDAAPGASD